MFFCQKCGAPEIKDERHEKVSVYHLGEGPGQEIRCQSCIKRDELVRCAAAGCERLMTGSYRRIMAHEDDELDGVYCDEFCFQTELEAEESRREAAMTAWCNR